MVFSSSIFLFGFLPAFLILYHIFPNNYLLLAFSLLFYAWGEPSFVFVMIGLVLIDYLSALVIDKCKGKAAKKALLAVSIALNLGLLIYFKYSGLLVGSFSGLFGVESSFNAPTLPIGISFFTFQAMSYVIDVFWGKVKVQKNPFYVLLYVSLFPQLIAGPIVRYETIEEQIKFRKLSIDKSSEGLEKFILGFVKKIIFANTMAQLADTIFGNEQNSFIVAWLGAVAYMLQIYYDFSGYSDMAIGIGKIIGFDFDENFNYPYCSRSVTEFWRRWHISLSTWFRDYVYIPLGGNRKGVARHIFNMLVVWALTGIWHGASWNFLLWGLYYFLLLVLEKYVFKNIIEKIPSVIRWCVTMFFVLIGWVIFRCEDTATMVSVFKSLFSFSIARDDINIVMMYMISYAMYMLPAIVLQFPIIPKIRSFIFDGEQSKKKDALKVLYYVSLLVVGFISVCFLVKLTYNPFIYFRF